MNITEVKNEEGFIVDLEVYITRKKDYRHIMCPKEKGTCPICEGPHRNLKAHHIIPKRLNTKNNYLKELRIKICNKCHGKIHPENKYILALKQLSQILIEVTNGEVDKIKEWKEIQDLLKDIKTVHKRKKEWSGKKYSQSVNKY